MAGLEIPATEQDAYRLFERLRWEGGQPCPHCDAAGKHMFIRPADGGTRGTRTGTRSSRRVWACRVCRRQFSVLTGTYLEGTKVPLRAWVALVARLCSGWPWTYRQLAAEFGVSPGTAWRMVDRIGKAAEREPRLRSILPERFSA